jgi:tetratricopeptide (TPR) repeat protein
VISRIALLVRPLAEALALACAVPATAQTPAVASTRGDSLMRAFDTSAAIETYRIELARDSTDVELLWRLARAISNLADEMPGDAGDRARHEEAVALAQRAVQLGPNVARAHATLAGTLGKLAQFQGGRRKVELARDVHREAERAVGIDPRDFVGFTILGVWHREVADLNPFLRAFASGLFGGLPDASLDQSRRYLERAVRLDPRAIAPHVELGLTYLALDREDAAHRELGEALALPPGEELDRIHQRRARELLRELEE